VLARLNWLRQSLVLVHDHRGVQGRRLVLYLVDYLLLPVCEPRLLVIMSQNPTTEPYSLPTGAAEGFRDAATYDTFRPSYPQAAVQSLLEKLRISDESDIKIVEIGSGTGKFTELLAARPEKFDILAVEPHQEMREQLVAKKLPGVEIVNAHAGKIPVGDGCADACIVAQAFHW